MTSRVESAMKKWEEGFGKTYGAGTLRRGVDIVPYEVIPTGSLTLDYYLGVGGLVEGRLHEIWGPDGVGKTTLSLLMIAEAQRKYQDRVPAFIDMEQKLDAAWAVLHGVDLTRLHIFVPESAEDVADAMKDFCRSGFHSLVVLDSVGAMIPEAEREKAAEDAVVGKQAGIVTRMVKLNAVEARKSGATVLMINQVRANLGYGADTTTGGGFALKHVTTTKLKVKRTGTPPYKAKIDGEDRVVGHEIAVTIERNAVAPAYRTAVLSLFHVATERFGPVGIDRADEAATLGIKTGLIHQAGAWYTLPQSGERVQGRDGVVAALRAEPDLITYIRSNALVTVAHEVHEEEAAASGPKFRKGAQE